MTNKAGLPDYGVSDGLRGEGVIDGDLGLRPAALEDAAGVADLETARLPDDPRDAEMVAYWWTHPWGAQVEGRWVAEREGRIWLFVSVGHQVWQPADRRFGSFRVSLHPDSWSEDAFRRAAIFAESWLRSEGTATATTRLREDLTLELSTLGSIGYREERREKFWELDLVANRDRLLEDVERSREAMRTARVTITTLDLVRDPEVMRQLYHVDVETTADIPTTVPMPVPTYEQWLAGYADNPGVRKDRFWLARIGDQVVGMSLIRYPPTRGIPSTDYTGVSPRHRGRGIARALKYETLAQAIAVGATRVRTDNDSENAPILHLNAEMGYRPATPVIELHRKL